MDIENKYGTLSMQQKLLKLLGEFDSFCLKEDIKYSLDSGSALGAVRHKGFIPWDDDVDVILDRENYNLLLSKIEDVDFLVLNRGDQDTLWVDRVRLPKTELINGYKPTIDIFILDNIPCGKIKAMTKFYIILFMQGMMKKKLKLKKNYFLMNFFSIISWLFGRFFTYKTIFLWYHKISQWGNKENSNYGSCYNYSFRCMGKKFDANLLNNVIRVPFENIVVSLMVGYDGYLKEMYGDYMTPPSSVDRSPQHIK